MYPKRKEADRVSELSEMMRVRISKALRKWYDATAKRLGRKPSDVYRQALEEYRDRQEDVSKSP